MAWVCDSGGDPACTANLSDGLKRALSLPLAARSLMEAKRERQRAMIMGEERRVERIGKMVV